VHPLEKADGYRQLLRLPGTYCDVASIAAKVGESMKYVYDRLKLLALIPVVREVFLEGKITAGHAVLLARLKPQDQERAIDQDDGALCQHEALLFNPDVDELADEAEAASPAACASSRRGSTST
jgi:ParB-like chromosome segregation protein Spo0J